MAKILVTGCMGTLGAPLMVELKKQGHEVWGCDLKHQALENYIRVDVSNHRQMERVFDQNYDYVYHLAAEFGRINGEEYFDTLWQTNVIGTRNILEWQKRKGFKLIFASSSEIYGESEISILREDLPMKAPIMHHNDYAMSKWVNEVQIMNFERRFDLPIVRLRFFNAYGPGEHYHRYRSVVCLFCYNALTGRPYDVFEGYHRVFMYMDDFIPTLAAVCDRFKAGRVYNIGGTEYRSVKELSDIVLKCTGASESLVNYLPEDKHNVVNKRPDITLAQNEFGHNPTWTLEQGVPQTIEWMRRTHNIGAPGNMRLKPEIFAGV